MKKTTLIFLLILNLKSVTAQEYLSNLIDPFADNINYFGLEYFYNENMEFMGYKRDRKIVIPAMYEYTQGFCEKGIARVTVKAPYEKSAEFLTPRVSGGYSLMTMIVSTNGLNGYIDTLGNVVVPIKYTSLGALEVYKVVPYSLYREENGEITYKFGLINDKGETITDAIYDYVYQYNKVYEARILKADGKYEFFYLDDTGREMGKDGKFDKFTIISHTPPMIFYAEYKENAYLLSSNLTPYAGTYIGERSNKDVITKLFQSYKDRYGDINQDLNNFYKNLTDDINK